MSTSASVEVDASDVLRLILQFLREQGLTQGLKAVQEESGVALNVLDNPPAFSADVLAGRWAQVLAVVATLKLPAHALMLLYEQVVRELAEAREVDAARALLRGTLPLLLLRQEDPARHGRLEGLVTAAAASSSSSSASSSSSSASSSAAPLPYADGTTREGRRADVLAALLEHTTTAPPSRLVALLGQALKWQQHTGHLPPGARVDLLYGADGAGGARSASASASADASASSSSAASSARRPAGADDDQRPCRQPAGVAVKFGAAARPECAAYTPDGASLVTGSVDGIVEVYDAATGKLRLDLPYQAADDFMLHDDAVLSLAASPDSELLASGGRDGVLKVWRLATGECLRRFPAAHGDKGAVASVAFSRDSSQVLSGGGDGVARIHGLRSGKCLKEFRGHAAFVSGVCWLPDGARVVTGSADGTARVWDVKLGECLRVLRPPQAVLTADAPVLAVLPVPRTPDAVVVVSRGPAIHLMATGGGGGGGAGAAGGAGGAVLRVFTHGRGGGGEGKGKRGPDFSAAALSPTGRWLYAVADDGSVYVFNVQTGALEHQSPPLLPAAAAGDGAAPRAGAAAPWHERGIVGAAHHPYRGALATWGDDGMLKVWQP
jgi:WD40 repeat-containing protein SMU1